MKMLVVLLSCTLVFLSTIECQSVPDFVILVNDVAQSSPATITPGSSFSLTCSASDLATGETISLGIYNVTQYDPNVIAGQTSDLKLVQGENYVGAAQPTRYTTSYAVDGALTTLTLMNSDAQSMDSGAWFCNVEDDQGNVQRKIATVSVPSPVSAITLTGANGIIADGSPLPAVKEYADTFLYTVTMEVGNTKPDICICIDNGQEKRNITSMFDLVPHSFFSTMENGLTEATSTYTFTLTDSQVLSDHLDHGSSLVIEASVPALEQTIKQSFPIMVEFLPKDFNCYSTEAHVGDTNAVITCECHAYPKPEISWYVADPLDNSERDVHEVWTDVDFDNEYTVDGLDTTHLIIPEIKPEHLTVYTLHASNSEGYTWVHFVFPANSAAGCYLNGMILLVSLVITLLY